MAFSLLLIILIAIGAIGFFVIMGFAGDYDFVTPFIAMGWAVIFIVVAIGLALGKWLF